MRLGLVTFEFLMINEMLPVGREESLHEVDFSTDIDPQKTKVLCGEIYAH